MLNKGLKPHLINWHVSDEAISDHRIILFELQVNMDSSLPTRNLRKTNLEKYKKSMQMNLANDRTLTRCLFNRTKKDGIWNSYRESLPSYNKRIRMAKRKSYRDFCESIGSAIEGARFHRAHSKRTPEAN